jgi:hypothetical protein
MFSYEMARRLQPGNSLNGGSSSSITVNALHPGVVRTELSRYLIADPESFTGKLLTLLATPFTLSPEQVSWVPHRWGTLESTAGTMGCIEGVHAEGVAGRFEGTLSGRPIGVVEEEGANGYSRLGCLVHVRHVSCCSMSTTVNLAGDGHHHGHGVWAHVEHTAPTGEISCMLLFVCTAAGCADQHLPGQLP